MQSAKPKHTCKSKPLSQRLGNEGGMTKKVIPLWLQKRPQGYNLHKNHGKLEVTSVQLIMEKGGRERTSILKSCIA